MSPPKALSDTLKIFKYAKLLLAGTFPRGSTSLFSVLQNFNSFSSYPVSSYNSLTAKL